MPMAFGFAVLPMSKSRKLPFVVVSYTERLEVIERTLER